jgi:hypothetical protein
MDDFLSLTLRCDEWSEISVDGLMFPTDDFLDKVFVDGHVPVDNSSLDLHNPFLSRD